MVPVETVLVFIGLVIVTGFFGNFLFEKLRIPDILLLLGMGVVIGQWLGEDAQALVRSFAPYFGTIAIIMILFEGGLTLDVKAVVGQLKNAFLLAIATFVLTLVWVAWAAIGWFGWAVLPSLMFGTIIGCTSSAVIVPTVNRSRAPEEIKALAVMESIFSDTIAIVVMVALLNLEAGKDMQAGAPVLHLAHAIWVALAVAVPVGLLWLNILEWTKARPLSYLWTFALLVLLYAGVHALGGSGALAVFFLALLIGNSRYLPRWLVFGKMVHYSEELIEKVAHQTLQWFHAELTFLVRSFFFVYIGLLFHVGSVKGVFLWSMIGFTAIVCAARFLNMRLIKPTKDAKLRPLLWAFLPRGLVSAVLATIPAARGVEGSEQFLDFTVPVIISTNVIMTLWVLGWEWRHGAAQQESSEAVVEHPA